MNATAQSAKILDLQPYLQERAARSNVAAAEADAGICREKLFAQVIMCDQEPTLVGRTWSCRTVRANADYVEFVCEKPLPVGSLVDLWVDLAARPGKFYLSGRVRWSRPSENGSFIVGIELEAGAATDLEAWHALLA